MHAEWGRVNGIKGNQGGSKFPEANRQMTYLAIHVVDRSWIVHILVDLKLLELLRHVTSGRGNHTASTGS